MNTVVDMITQQPKGLRVDPKYLPEIGEVCIASGPNEDNAEGYAWGEVTLHWRDDMFCVYGRPGCWPVLHKLDHVLFRPIEADQMEITHDNHN